MKFRNAIHRARMRVTGWREVHDFQPWFKDDDRTEACACDGCTRVPRHHVIWDAADGGWAGSVCDQHFEEVKGRYVYAFVHPYRSVCDHPESRFYPDDNECRLENGELERIAHETKELQLVSESTFKDP